VRYGTVLDKDFMEDSTEKYFHTYEGRVRPHPEFAFLLDNQGAIRSSRADLATILLDSPSEENLPPVLWAETEVQTDELLVMAGYGQDNRWGGTPGIRYFRTNQVTQVLDAPRGRVLYEQRGAFLYNGYAGGPSFRELGSKRWLVGIAGQGSERELSFTSLRPFKDWLQAEVRHAAGSAPVLATPPFKPE
jgi:hypothetical protein